MRTLAVATLGALSFLVGPAIARAGNDEGIPVGNWAPMTGGVGVTTAVDGGALVYNPALLASIERDRIDLSGNLFLYRFNDLPRLLSSTLGPTAGTSGVEVNAVPDTLAYARRLVPGVVMAFGLFVTEATSYSQSADLDLDGPPPLRVRIDSNEVTRNWHGVLGIGFEVMPQLRLGTYVFVDENSMQRYGSSYADQRQGDDVIAISGTTERFNVDLVGLGIGFGLHWAPGGGFELGFSVQSARLDVGASYSTSSSTFRADDDEIDGTTEDTSSFDLGVASSRPFVFRLGVAYRFGRAWIAADCNVRTPLVDDRVLERREWSANAHLGGFFELDDEWAFGAGLFTDRSPFVALDPAQVVIGARRLDFYGGTFGVRTSSRIATQDADRPTLVFDTWIAGRYAYGFGDAVGFEIQDDSTTGTQVVVPTTTHEVSLHVGSSMRF